MPIAPHDEWLNRILVAVKKTSHLLDIGDHLRVEIQAKAPGPGTVAAGDFPNGIVVHVEIDRIPEHGRWIRPAGQVADKIGLVFLRITELVRHFMGGDERLQKDRNGGVHLPFTGKSIVVTLEAEVIAGVAEKGGLDGPGIIVQEGKTGGGKPVSFVGAAEKVPLAKDRIPLFPGHLPGIIIQPGLQGDGQGIEVGHGIGGHPQFELTGDSPPVVVEAPEQVEEDINEEEEKDSLLQPGYKIGPVELPGKKEAEKLVGAKEDDQDEEAVEKVADADRYPPEYKALKTCNQRVDAVGVVALHPVRIETHPFDTDGRQDQEDPGPAFHEMVE